MNRRGFMRSAAAGVGLAALGAGAATGAAPPRKPNILFIFADDQTYETVHALGCSEIETPNLDRLVRGGTTFTHAYNQGAWHGAVCVASRTMLVTGAFVWDAMAREPHLGKDAEAERLWPQLLSRAGYETYMSGKWHVKVDPARIFDHVRNVRPGMPNQTEAGYDRPKEGQDDPWKPWDRQHGGYWKGGKHWSEVLGDDGVGFLEQAAGREAPFFMYLAFNAPHDPRQSPKEYVERYPLDGVAVPKDFLPEYPHKEAMGCGENLRDERLAPFPRTPHAVKVHRQEYYAIITHMDAQVGRILDALEASGKADGTVVIFTADHGLACGHHGLMGKQNMFDHSLRAPLMIMGPGIPAGARNSTPVYLQDIMPTALALAGAEVPERVAFRNLLPLIEGARAEQYGAIYGAYMNKQRMVADEGFKLVHYPTIDKTLLFNLENDPDEMHDLADDPEYAEIRTELRAKLDKLQETLGDPLVSAE
ncbi:MAG: sulfatase-like hydrolase/transferase [Candidatus Hydrogenedentota bacterium]